jgi:phosphoglycolate phosphatase
MKIILFDIDGTLLLTGGAGKHAFNRIFKDLYNEEAIWQDIQPGGRTDVSLIKECFDKRWSREPSEDEIKAVKQAYIEALPAELPKSENFRLMPHVKETLTALKDRKDVALGIVTGNFKDTAWQKLKHAELDSYFHFGGYGCDSEDRLELTEVAIENAMEFTGDIDSEIYVIGDTVADMQCGKAVFATTIGVCTGPASRAELEAEEPAFVLNDLSEFPKI